MTTTIWKNCYSQQWAGILIPPAFAHPAKISLALVKKIFAHALEQGWIRKGDTCVDPFAGVGGVAFGAMAAGLKFTGQELEPHFVELANGMDCTDEKLCPTCIARSQQSTPENLSLFDEPKRPHRFEGNLEFWKRKFGLSGAVIVQGDSRKLLENLRGRVECVVSSPPFEDNGSKYGIDGDIAFANKWQELHGKRILGGPFGYFDKKYGHSENQIGNLKNETFWSAAREIVQQCFLALKPGGHAIWVCKNFVRKGQIVEFSQQWAKLCESVGFKLVCWHLAMLTDEGAVQINLDGEETRKVRERKSFFRRLAEKNGSPRIDWEDVICFVKPAQTFERLFIDGRNGAAKLKTETIEI